MIDWKIEGNFAVKWPVNGPFVIYQFEISNRRTTGEEILSKLQEHVCPPPPVFLGAQAELMAPGTEVPSSFPLYF